MSGVHDKKPSEDIHPIEALIEVMARLRDPQGGCPWDLEQDFKSIAPYTIEEAYEVADAIAREDMRDLREELGDLLFQPVYHAQMASEQDLFDFNDVVRDVTEKMISRHPHVFGDVRAEDAADVDAIWDQRKKAENRDKDKGSDSAYKGSDSALDGVTKALPALLRAYKLQKKAAKVGFEWTDPSDVLDKLEEELGELREAVAQGTFEDKAEELGDVLFVVANLGRLLDVNPETALRECNDKFERRFRGIEGDLQKIDQPIEDASLEQMTRLWDLQKQKERKQRT